MQEKEELLEQLLNLQRAIAEGTLEVEFQGKRIKYRSLDEMRRIERVFLQQLQSGRGGEFKKVVTVFEKF